MNKQPHIVTRSADRFSTRLDWLESYHSFSFGEHYDPNRMGFGPLRVVNDDIIAPGGGFAPHPHRNMEIVTILLEGQLQHKDSLGNGRVIESGEIQYMSAGSGVVHSEYNPSKTKPTHLLQIWIEPSQKGLPPDYEDRRLLSQVRDSWRLVLSDDGRDHSMKIRQEVELRSAVLQPGAQLDLQVSAKLPAQWIFVISGSVQVGGETLHLGDSLGTVPNADLHFKAGGEGEAEVLVFSLPR